ncbi:MAG TPA: hypothetical protein DEF43_03005, partial [Chloroflexus aurantiacus]|nr:hypothetical protein [Chloroflexus aurantiacus]
MAGMSARLGSTWSYPIQQDTPVHHPMHYPYLAYCIARVPERVGGVMTNVLPSREPGARASGA